MSTSIFNVSSWATTTSYNVNDIVLFGSLYYYCLVAHSSTSFATDKNNGYWGGVALDSYGNQKPQFVWKGSYNSNSTVQPKVKVIKFGDSYEQRSPDGINNALLDFDMSFEARGLVETTAILHFFYQRAGHESFLFLPPAPYDSQKLFVCRSWQHTLVFYDNNTIKARFEEVAN